MKKLLISSIFAVGCVSLISCGGGGGDDNNNTSSNSTPNYSTNLSADLAQVKNNLFLQNMSFQTMSNILDIQHQTSMAIINNMSDGWDIDYDYSYYSVDNNPADISKVLPQILKQSLKANSIYPQGTISKTLTCGSGGDMTVSLDWTNTSCDFNATPIDKNACYKNNDITFSISYNSCKESNNTSSVSINGNLSLGVKFPSNPKTNNEGDYLPNYLSMGAKNLNFSIYVNNTSYQYNLTDMALNFDLDNNKATLNLTMKISQGTNTLFETKDLKIVYQEQNKIATFSLNGFLYGASENSTPQWYKFETIKDFKMKTLSINGTNYECTTDGEMKINDVLTVKVVKDNTDGFYYYEVVDKDGKTAREKSCETP